MTKFNLNEAKKDEDAAQRISDTVSLHLVAATDLHEEVTGKWCAFRLDDGRSDNTVYPTKDDAIRHQKGNPKNYCYLKITPDGIRPKHARQWLRANRHPLIDTTAPEHVINPHIYPHMSNLTPQQRYAVARMAEREARHRG